MTTHLAPSPAPLHSAQWFRVADLRPLLHERVACQRQVQRDEVWHVLTLPDGRRSFRLNATAWSLIARCDGRRSTQQLWDIGLAEWGDHTPTQDELLSILARLHDAGLLSFDRRPDFGAEPTDAAVARDEAPHRRNSWLAWRLPLGRPDVPLDRVARLLAPCLGWPALLAWGLAVMWGVLAGSLHASEWTAQVKRLLMSHNSWGVIVLTYPLLKFVHEAAHGLAARRWGASVSEWGLSLLMFVPVPYVDVSAASALPRRRQRLLVASAGMLAESALAVLAFGVWLNVQPGALRDAALLVFFMAGLSTLLVNANPLLRFDGYHMLCDALSLPNLATRSSQYHLQRLAHRLLREQPASALTPAAGEAPWLMAYAPAALMMRCVIAWSAVFWLGGISRPLGWLVALLFGWSMVLVPLFRLVRWMRRGDLKGFGGGGSLGRRGLVLAPLGLTALVALWPLPVITVAQGVLWLPEHALVRSQSAGMIQDVLVADGQLVQAGDALIQLASPTLAADVDALRGQVDMLQAEQLRSLQAEPAQAVQAAHRLQAALAELEQGETRLERLTVRAQSAGRIAIDKAMDLPGRYVQRGELLAQVLTGEAGIVRLAVPHDRAAQLGLPTVENPDAAAAKVQVQLADPAAAPRWAHWLGQPSGGVTQLPSAALGERSGGRIATDASDPRGLRPTQPVLVGELQLEGPAAHRLGERVLVRFEHGRAPLLLQWADQVQKQVLHHFNPHT